MSDLHVVSRQQNVETLTPLVVSPKMAATMLACGLTRLYALLNAGELASYHDGGSRRVLVRSIENYVKNKLATNSGAVRRRPGRPKKQHT
jgi:hypothetical protein